MDEQRTTQAVCLTTGLFANVLPFVLLLTATCTYSHGINNKRKEEKRDTQRTNQTVWVVATCQAD